MTCIRAPRHLIAAVGDGLIDGSMILRTPVVVPVAPQRRGESGWPAVILAAVVVGANMAHGVLAVWATSEYGAPIMAVDGASREFSLWPASAQGWIDTDVACINLIDYFEVDEARKCVLLLETRDPRVSRRASKRDQASDVDQHPE